MRIGVISPRTLIGAMPSPAGSDGVEVRVRGSLGADDEGCARAMVSAVLGRYGLLRDGATVRLTSPAAGSDSVVVQVNLRVHGAPARIQVSGPTTGMAIAAGAIRLSRQIRRLTRGGDPWPWPDPERVNLASGFAGTITRIKNVRLRTGIHCQAVSMMNAMDYDVHLFTDVESGEDAIVYRTGPTGIRLARQHRMHPPLRSRDAQLTVNPHKVPTLAPADAADRMISGYLPFLFFTSPDTKRGNLLYRRYDGDIGLLRPHAPAASLFGR